MLENNSIKIMTRGKLVGIADLWVNILLSSKIMRIGRVCTLHGREYRGKKILKFLEINMGIQILLFEA